MKKSDEIRAKIAAAEDALKEAMNRHLVIPSDTNEDVESKCRAYHEEACPIHDMMRGLENDLQRALAQEIEVGDGVTVRLYTDAHACTVIARTAKTLTVQRDKATRDPSFVPQWVPGGFSAICTNNNDQKWNYQRDPSGEIIKCHWSEARGRWQAGERGCLSVTRGRHEFYDYNF